jgi:two-component system phosphate regulon sensor histidine kinase PhoR
MQSDFVANASHELRTPLSVISGFVETLLTTAKNDPQASEQFLKIISTQAEYMSGLIENLLSLSRIELNQDNPPTNEVDIIKVVKDVIETMRLKAQDNNMKIVLEKNKDIKNVKGDENQLKQVIQNLLGNAIKYGEQGTAITLKLKNSDNIPSSKTLEVDSCASVKISVNNKGPKLDSDKLARLTERFYRLQEHKDQNIKGTGLGLSIVKHIVIRHKGNLTITSTATNGTTFSVYIPSV